AHVGVALHLDRRELGVVLQRLGDRVHDLHRFGEDLGAPRFEEDLLEDHDVVALNDDVPLVRATVVVLVGVERLRIVRALVVPVGDPVVIVIGIGAAVGVFEAVLVLGIVRALVLFVGDAVVIVVGIGATVGVFEAVAILRLVGAFIVGVEDA